MATFKQFEELPVWKKAKDLAIAIYSLTKREPFSKDYGLVDQIRRAAVSVSSNIAEGYERGTKAEFIQFLYVARGSCGEVRSQLAIAQDLGYIAEGSFEKHYGLCIDTSKQINGLIEYMKDVKMKGQKFQASQDKSREAFLKLLAQYSTYGRPSG